MIRKAVREDIDTIEKIYIGIHERESAGLMKIGWLPKVYPVRGTAEAALERGDLFVYEENGSVLASAIINQTQVDSYALGKWSADADDDKVMVLHTLVVDPDEGKRGIGREFVRFYEEYAAKLGCEWLRMDTNEKNAVARAFYKKLGYDEIGIVPCVFNGIPDVKLVLLEKRVLNQ